MVIRADFAVNTAAPLPALSAAFTAWMAELDELQQLRARDPAASLKRMAERRHGWPPLAAAEDTMLRARCSMHTGAAHLLLGQHAEAEREFKLLEQLLATSELATATRDLRHHARRCGIAGANARAVLAHALGDFAVSLPGCAGQFARHRRPALRSACAGEPGQHLRRERAAGGIAGASAPGAAHRAELGMDELVGDIHRYP